jgi:hypothetical protein
MNTERGYAIFVMIGLLLGAVAGYLLGQPSAGTLIGGGLGGLLAVLFTWRDRRRRPD